MTARGFYRAVNEEGAERQRYSKARSLRSCKFLRDRGPDAFASKAQAFSSARSCQGAFFLMLQLSRVVLLECGHWACFAGSSLVYRARRGFAS